MFTDTIKLSFNNNTLKIRIKYSQVLYSADLSISYDRPYGNNYPAGTKNIPYNYDFEIPSYENVETTLKFHYVGAVDDKFHVIVNGTRYIIAFNGWHYSIGDGYLTLKNPSSSTYHITHAYYNGNNESPMFLWLRKCTVTIEWTTK